MRVTTLKLIAVACALAVLLAVGGAPARAAGWRAATAAELKKLLPTRAPVIRENIETESRTASGVTDGRGKFIAGVVMITAGYSAEGKYSHFLITHVPIRVGDMELSAGEYVFGYRRADNETIRVSFYRAANGEAVGTADAHLNRKSSRVVSLLIAPPSGGKGYMQIGRFVFEYRVAA